MSQQLNGSPTYGGIRKMKRKFLYIYMKAFEVFEIPIIAKNEVLKVVYKAQLCNYK